MQRRSSIPYWFGLLIFGIASVVHGDDDVLTFFATSDSHYEAIEHVERNDRNRVTIERMNAMPGQPWPEKLGRGVIGTPRGVLALGDLIDDGADLFGLFGVDSEKLSDEDNRHHQNAAAADHGSGFHAAAIFDIITFFATFPFHGVNP